MLPGLFLLCGVDCFLYRSEPPVLEGTTNSAWGPPTSIFDQEKKMVLPTFLQDNLVEALSHLRSPVCLCQVNGKKKGTTTKTRVWQQSAPTQGPQEKPKDNSILHHQPFPGLESSCYSVNTFLYSDPS